MRACVTFVGPIQESGKTAKKWSILVVQTGEPIQLDYDSEDDSLGARRALLAAPNAFSVPTVKLLYAFTRRSWRPERLRPRTTITSPVRGVQVIANTSS